VSLAHWSRFGWYFGTGPERCRRRYSPPRVFRKCLILKGDKGDYAFDTERWYFMNPVTGKVFEQTIRLEAIKAAARVASIHETTGNLLVHADWISTFIFEGKQPLIETEEERA